MNIFLSNSENLQLQGIYFNSKYQLLKGKPIFLYSGGSVYGKYLDQELVLNLFGLLQCKSAVTLNVISVKDEPNEKTLLNEQE